MTNREVNDTTKIIKQLICEHMPTAAVASGWMSAIDPEPFVKQMCERFPFDVRPEQMGVTYLTDWLSERGVTAGKAFVLAVRNVWLMERMRAECDKGCPVQVFCDPA